MPILWLKTILKSKQIEKNVNLVQFMDMLIIDYEVRQVFTDFIDFLRRKCVTSKKRYFDLRHCSWSWEAEELYLICSLHHCIFICEYFDISSSYRRNKRNGRSGNWFWPADPAGAKPRVRPESQPSLKTWDGKFTGISFEGSKPQSHLELISEFQKQPQFCWEEVWTLQSCPRELRLSFRYVSFSQTCSIIWNFIEYDTKPF